MTISPIQTAKTNVVCIVSLIEHRCNSLGLIDRCVKIEARQATKDELLYKHTAGHVELLESTENYNENQLERTSSKYDSIYIHPVGI